MAYAWVVPFTAAVVSAAFAGLVWERWATNRAHSHLAWGIGLTLYAAASLAQAFADGAGWTVPLYRAYVPMTSSLVGFLGLGTLYLLRQQRIAQAFAVYVITSTLAVATLQFGTPVTPTDLAGHGSTLGLELVPTSNPGRVASILLNILGGLVLIGGAIWSAAQLRNLGVLLIGVGALLPFLGGSLTTLGFAAGPANLVSQFLGIAVMFLGFLRASPQPATPAAPEATA